jgi:hypothetical protein
MAAVPSNTNGALADQEKCCFCSCRVKGAQKIQCSSGGCDKLVHLMCYQGLLLGEPSFHPLLANKVACTKKCYEKAARGLSGGGEDQEEGGRMGRWDYDGINGPDDSHTSTKILLDW